MEASGTSHHQAVSQECRVVLDAHAPQFHAYPLGEQEDKRRGGRVWPLRAEPQGKVVCHVLGLHQAGGRDQLRPEAGPGEVRDDLAEESATVMRAQIVSGCFLYAGVMGVVQSGAGGI